MIRIAQGFALDDLLQASMFEDRRRLFVELMGWDVPVTPQGHEIDQSDGDAAIYIAGADEAGLHIGSLRLLPTDRPHILGSLFHELVGGELPIGPAVLEITRLCLPTRLGARPSGCTSAIG
jgi:acyl-homoserine lactone synthase